ncbi:NitT/TauT family transport system ATP-binding protein [Rhodococcus wratislaviensis]|uniref:ABC transporter ATP-binding protein n=2 Tax=Rhodococcus wratislaviensis TaxID=44752 RepID=A0AB38FEV7_RHOWR|nr:NitT/TauT family transport system ATP-binding protein [Rhodococcus wratislaviensis]SPZ40001.1 putative ABC transporter ATP-binding protein [Rhodococcus wratislaviensis]
MSMISTARHAARSAGVGSPADPGRNAIEFEGVEATYPAPQGGTRTVLSGIDLQIPAGEFIAIVGRSGCGKTTLLNMAAGLVDPAAGRVSVMGKTPRDARSHLGFMLARDALLPWRSALRNVEYGLELRGVRRAERRALGRRWLQAVHLEEAGHLWPWQLSQGMRQRVALARTWALDPEVLLMDEPFAALDVNTRMSVQKEFLELWQREAHRTVIFVTHDLGEAVALADRIVLMGEGKVLDDVQVDIPRPRELATVSADPRYQAIYERLRERLH